MPDYRLMYCELMAAVEQAVEILRMAQRECAWIYEDAGGAQMPDSEGEPPAGAG